MDLISSVRKSLRTSSDFDDEIQDLIFSAISELRLGGVHFLDERVNTDPLLKRAITVYAKANFGLENPDSAKYQESFDSLKKHLSLSGDYRVG